MNKTRLALGIVGAILLPVVLSVAAYFVSARSFATTAAVRAPLAKLGRPRRSPASPSPSVSAGADLSGNCDEAEHQNDPACSGVSPTPGSEDSGKSGSGDSGRSGSDDSGKSGSDDSASGGSGSSGSGSDSGDSGSGGSGDSGSGASGSGSEDSGSSGGDD